MQNDNGNQKLKIKRRFSINGDTLFLIILAIIIFAFIYFLPTLYDKMMYIKANGLFPKKEVVEEIPDEEEEEEVKKVTICTKTDTKEEGKISYKITFNHPNSKITSVSEVTEYISNEGSYLTEIDAANKYFSELKDDFENYNGFKINLNIQPNTYKAELILDLSLLDIDAMNEKAVYNPLDLKYSYNQNITEVTTIYNNDGYVCE